MTRIRPYPSGLATGDILNQIGFKRLSIKRKQLLKNERGNAK